MILPPGISHQCLIFVSGVKKHVMGYPTPSTSTNPADQATMLLPGEETLELVGQHLTHMIRGEMIMTPSLARIPIPKPYDNGIWLHQA